MTLQNRVLPTGEIVAQAERGTLMGNRGILHDAHRRLGRARWRHRNWICCELAFKDRKREVMQPGGFYTELFFLDEAVALAAGHRPCAECRRPDYTRFRAAWATAFGTVPAAPEIDRLLHAARVAPLNTVHLTHEADAATLPDSTFIRHGGIACLIQGARLLPYTPGRYGPATGRPIGTVTVLTPRPLVAVLAAGYRPRLHPSAL